MRVFFATLLLIISGCSPSPYGRPIEVKYSWGSYKEYFPDVIEYEYIKDIWHDGVLISCASGQGFGFNNQAIVFEDTRNDTKSRVFEATSIAINYLPYCPGIQSIEDFEIALAELKLMEEAIDICGEMNVDGTGEKLREVMACQEDIIYEKSSTE
tara:strand:- start:100 stop:564 length:465 start_codon:yes stop_codon:yes gene_type:complete